MSAPSICARLLEQYPRSFVEEAGVPTRPSTPRAAFQLLCAALLFGARIRIDVAQRTVRALKAAGWTTPSRLLDAGEAQRVAVLTVSGYGRYADAKAAQLADAARKIRADYAGDLRRLRAAAGHEPERERALLLAFAGVGPVAADAFLRQAQTEWDELHPYVDPRAAQALAAAGLPRTGRGLARHVASPAQLCRIIDGAIRRERGVRGRASA
jgi:endonuclease III